MRTLILALACTALFAAPAVAQEAMPVEATLTLAEEAADAAAEAAEEAADGSAEPDSSTSDADADAPPPDADDPDEEGDLPADAPAAGAAPARQSRSSLLVKGINGGAITVKARTKVTQRLLAPAKKGKKAKLLGSATKTARRAGTIRLTIKLNAAGRAFVKAGATKVTLKTVINPAKGRTKTTTRTITITA